MEGSGNLTEIIRPTHHSSGSALIHSVNEDVLVWKILGTVAVIAQPQLIRGQRHMACPLPHQHRELGLVTEHLYFWNARDGRQLSQHVEVRPPTLAGAEDGVVLGKVKILLEKKKVLKKSGVMARKRSVFAYHCDETAGKHAEKHLCRPHGGRQRLSGSLSFDPQQVVTNKVWWAGPGTGVSD